MIKFYGKKNISVLITFVLACVITCLFVIYKSGINALADDKLTEYKQIIFNQDNGLGASEINCIYQTQSGYIWVGTDGGLYRYNGSEFKLYSLWDTDKQDVFYINSIFQDSKGRLWIATNNYGLFCISSGKTIHFDAEYYSGVKCVNDVCEGSDGKIYIATAYGIYIVNEEEENMFLVRNEQLAKHNIEEITLAKDKIWGIYNGNTIFCLLPDGTVNEKSSTDYTDEELSTISSDKNGRLYIGTIGNDVIRMDAFNSYKILISAKDGVNDIVVHGNRVYVCADAGVGYFRTDDSFMSLNSLAIDSYINDLIVDYEGNLWFASKRSGILYMAHGKFSNMNRKYNIPESVTNAVCIFNGNTYIGTDDGLFILDNSNNIVNNDLTEYFKQTYIRDIVCDTNGNLWFATYKKYGVVKYTPGKNSKKLTGVSKASGLVSNFVTCLCALDNGNVAAGTEDGISIIKPDGTIEQNYNYENGLEYVNISCLYQDKNGILYAGSEGGGLYKIEGDKVKAFTDADGLNSNVVTAITEGTTGFWIGTNNGLSYYSDTFRSISNIDFSNSIYNIFMKGDVVYIIGSKGFIYATENELLGTKALSERYYSYGDGIEAPITANSKNYFDGTKCYICTNKGIITYDSENIYENEVAPRVTISEVDVDGETKYFNQYEDTIEIPADAQRVEISFAVLTFSNRENIKVRYQLIGFDNEPQYLSGTDILQAVYTNLEGGTYTFDVSASNGDGVESEDVMSFTINKEPSLFERKGVRYSLAIVLSMLILLTAILTLRLQRKFVFKNRELEDLAKEHETIVKSSSAKTDYLANMSNEIKLPINAMISSANNILKDGNADESTEKGLREIINSGQDVLGKVDETILLARLESGAEEMINEPYSITTLICDLSDKMLNSLADQPIKFLVDLGENIPDILIGDFDKIKNVLNIILDNAIKFTKEGSITLSVDSYSLSEGEEDDINLVFSVSDTGIGITEERLEHMFEIYYVDEAKKIVDQSGNGISMSIAKKIIEILGGDIAVESTVGAGTTFTVSLSQKKPEANGGPIPLNENTVDRISREEAEKMWAPDLHVLVVDDVEISRNVTLDVITAMEIKCDTASSGLSAIDMVMNNDYDLVFMDIAMPVMNGIDSLREIRELSGKRYKTLPVVAMSEDVIGKNREEIINEGFADVVLKPFDITVLAGILQKHVDSSKIKFRSNDVTQYISESRYSDGLKKLEDFFDVAGVLERIGGSIDVYNRILTTFYNQNKNANVELRSRFNNDYRGFRNKIHNIRNGCQNIGAVEAAEITLRIENAINLGNKSYVRDNMNLVFDCIKVINQYIEEYLTFIEASKGVTDEEYAAKHKNAQATTIPGDKSLPKESSEEAYVDADSGDVGTDSAASGKSVSGNTLIRDPELEQATKKLKHHTEILKSRNGKTSGQGLGAGDSAYDDGRRDGGRYGEAETNIDEFGSDVYGGAEYRDVDGIEQDMYDEENVGRTKDEQSAIININKLRIMREATYVEDINVIKNMYQEIQSGLYGAEDNDFLKVLGESIEKKDFVEINDLLGTYISLKSTL